MTMFTLVNCDPNVLGQLGRYLPRDRFLTIPMTVNFVKHLFSHTSSDMDVTNVNDVCIRELQLLQHVWI